MDSTHILSTQYGQVSHGQIPCKTTDLVLGFDSLFLFLSRPRVGAEFRPSLSKTLKHIGNEEDANL